MKTRRALAVLALVLVAVGVLFWLRRAPAPPTVTVPPVHPRPVAMPLEQPKPMPRPTLEALGDGGPLRVPEEGFLLKGRVLDDQGVPVENVGVLTARMDAFHPPVIPTFLRTATDATGHFQVRVPSAGEYGVVCNPAPPFVLTFAKEPAKVPGPDVELRLNRGMGLDGVVLDEKRTPVPNAQVSVGPPHEQMPFDGATSDAAGHFHLTRAPVGLISLSASLFDDSGERRTTKELELHRGDTRIVELVFAGGDQLLRGRVVDTAHAGVPLADVRIEWHTKDSSFSRTVRANEQGHFEARVPPGTLQCRAEGTHEGRSFHGNVECSANAGEVTIVVEREPRITGRLVHKDGSPVLRGSVGTAPVNSPDGRFDVPWVMSPSSQLVIESPGMSPVLRDRMGPPHDLDLGDIVMGAGHALRGQVVDADTGKSLAGATVNLASEKLRLTETFPVAAGNATALETTTDADGHFALNVDDDACFVMVHAADFVPQSFPVSAGQTEATFRMHRGGSVEVTTYAVGGEQNPPTTFVVLAKRDNSFHLDRSGGRVTFDGLPSGTFVVGTSCAGGEWVEQDVSLAEREHLTVSLHCRGVDGGRLP